ncbi:MAG: helix-turn-helix transcriptional regulator [Cellulomonadaceae bacterium]|nr:helix-turn-helix transcriptional regulator [Cellulomonadaceae bacterium]
MSRAPRPGPDQAVADAETGAGEHRVVCHLDTLLAARGLTLTELAQRAGVTVVNLSVLKNDRARAIRFSTLTAICDALDCQPGDLLSVTRSAP